MWPFDLFTKTQWLPGTVATATGSSQTVAVEGHEIPVRVNPKDPLERRFWSKDFLAELTRALERSVFSGDASVIQAKFTAKNPLDVTVTISGANVKLWVSSKKHIRVRTEFIADLREALAEMFATAAVRR